MEIGESLISLLQKGRTWREIKKFGARQGIEFFSRNPKRLELIMGHVRRRFKTIVEETAEKEQWTQDYLANRLKASEHFAYVVSQVLPEVNPRTRSRIIENFFINQVFDRTEKKQIYLEKHGTTPPQFLLASPSMNCNLKCKGCWARKYKQSELDASRFSEVLHEAKQEMGIHYVVLTGGEPTMWEPIWDIVAEHQDIAFMPYTNGTLIDEKMASKIADLGNFYPCVSIDGNKEDCDSRRGQGTYDKTQRALRELKDKKCFFGFSATHTRDNHQSMINREFLEDMIEKGARIGWLFSYVPLGDSPTPELMPTPEQRVERFKIVDKLREDKRPLLMYDFWMDGPLVGGCLGFGRKYIHINSDGFVEPCAFIHFSTGNINEKSLTECVNDLWLKEARVMQPFNENLFAPCPYIDNPEVLKKLVETYNVQPTHEGAENCVHGPLHDAVCKNSEAYKLYLEEQGLDFRGYCRECHVEEGVVDETFVGGVV